MFAVRLVSPRYSPPYPVIIGKDLVKDLGDILAEYTRLNPLNCLVAYPQPLEWLANTVVQGLSSFCTHVYKFALPDGEDAKRLEKVLELVEFMHRLGFSRRDLVVVAGGGAASDSAGFAAAIYKRGVPYVNIPSTLLSMVDAAIGGKVAVNHAGLKNLLGTFYQPRAVIEDVSLLATLPKLEVLSGLGEIVKYAYTLSAELHDMLVKHGTKVVEEPNLLAEAVSYSVNSKARIVELDEREEYGLREILNFGHTFGHALEEAAKGEVKHGIAVAWGCVVESWAGVHLGFTPRWVAEELESLVRRLGFPQPKLPEFDILTTLMAKDKKVHGDVIRGVFPLAPGRGLVVDVRLKDYVEAVRRAAARVWRGE
ncbi:3-dehydroquinate synthase [Pyrolobus fumarii]|uniref:3-dehydroquinate synthase n=1 Tax=Pyrolobus fumarii TaxID=54252 RepID=UPI001FCC39A3|nr:3-dehydroquinate synthase family protein [Pyrolobus fumarii]